MTVELTEKQFRQMVLDLAKVLGWCCYHTWTSIHSAGGFPDLILVRDCVILAVELKSEKGKVTSAQQEWLSALGKASVKTYVWRPSDWDDIVRCLQNDEPITNANEAVRGMS